jgi:hypothetical protein
MDFNDRPHYHTTLFDGTNLNVVHESSWPVPDWPNTYFNLIGCLTELGNDEYLPVGFVIALLVDNDEVQRETALMGLYFDQDGKFTSFEPMSPAKLNSYHLDDALEYIDEVILSGSNALINPEFIELTKMIVLQMWGLAHDNFN